MASSLALVLLVAALAAVPIAGAAGPPLPTGGLSAGTVGVNSSPDSLATLLAAPWSARAGYAPELAGSAIDVTPVTDGTVEIVLTLASPNSNFATVDLPTVSNFSAVAGTAGVSLSEYDALASHFTALGFTVTHRWQDRLFLSLRGTPAEVDAAFGSALESGQYAGRSVVFPATAPSLPAPFQSEVAAVSGLQQGFTTFDVPYLPASLPGPQQGRTTTTVTPSAVHLLYGLNGLYNYSGTTHWATGVGISLVLWGDGYDPADLTSFFQQYYPGGFPAETIAPYPVDGAPAPSPGAVNDPSNVTSELTLDLEWAGSAAPGATLNAVYAPDGPSTDHYSPSDASLEDALNTAIQIAGTQVVSMSFGSPDGQDLSFQTAYETALKAADMAQETVLVASGDNAGTSGPKCTGTLAPEYPAASQWVVAVGGTAPVVALDPFGGVTGLDSEPAWNRTGGGYSVVYSAPSWQLTSGSGTGPVQANGHRGIPDVAGPAQDNIFFFNGAETAGAGTSFASPMWAGMIAEMDAIRGHPLGYITPRLYSVGLLQQEGAAAIGLADITSGANCLGSATPGWDDVTGWGTPRADLLYPDLSGTFVNVSLSLSADSVAPGGSFSTTALITNSTDHAPVAGVNVTISVSDPSYLGPCGGTFTDQLVMSNATGLASASATIPACYLGSTVTVTANVSGRYYGVASATVHVNLVGLAGFLAVVQVFPYNVITFVLLVLAAALVGWRIDEWRHRARMRRARAAAARRPVPSAGRPPPPTGQAASAQPPPAPPPRTPPDPPAAPVVPAVDAPSAQSTEPGAVPSEDAGPSLPVVVPDHVSAAEGWSAPPPITHDGTEETGIPAHVGGGSPSPRPVLCPACGAALPGDGDRCPACGADVTAPGRSPS